uniref:Uncharacterized protein n=1 Tax=Anguilla anguilla TaxID=7936 RepID=A0A0E9QWM4_ANGAN
MLCRIVNSSLCQVHKPQLSVCTDTRLPSPFLSRMTEDVDFKQNSET